MKIEYIQNKQNDISRLKSKTLELIEEVISVNEKDSALLELNELIKDINELNTKTEDLLTEMTVFTTLNGEYENKTSLKFSFLKDKDDYFMLADNDNFDLLPIVFDELVLYNGKHYDMYFKLGISDVPAPLYLGYLVSDWLDDIKNIINTHTFNVKNEIIDTKRNYLWFRYHQHNNNLNKKYKNRFLIKNFFKFN